MPRFTLRPCYVREDKVAFDKQAAPLILDWDGLCNLLAPARRLEGLTVLSHVKRGAIVGRTVTVQDPSMQSVFMLQNRTNSRSLEWVARQDTGFLKRITSVYYVEDADWGDVRGSTEMPCVVR